MGDREEAGRLPGEIIEVYRAPLRPGAETKTRRDPREVVECYRPPDPREIVETYSRPVPRRTERPLAVPRVQPPARRRKRGLVRFLACVTLLVGLALGARLAQEFRPRDVQEGIFPSYTHSEPEEITIPTWPVGLGASLTVHRELEEEELTAQEVYRRLNPSVVTVQCWTGGAVSIGTGVIFTEDGYIVTNYHVVRGGRDCSVVLDSGYLLSVCYVAGDEDSDLAVLKVPPGELQPLESLPAASFGDSEQLVVGDPVYAIGAPRQLSGTLTNGIISAIDRDIEVEGRTMTLLQTNAALNSGNSGGPLINGRGQVVGINVAKYMSDHDSVEGLGFAIPSAQMERIINDLLTCGEVQPEPRLGVTVISPATILADGYQGLLVDSVTPGGSADRAGIQAGDYILTAEGESILNTQDLFRVRRRLYVGDTMTMTLWRQGAVLEVTLTLDEAAD